MLSFELATLKKGKQLISEDDQYLRELLPHEYALKMNENKLINKDDFVNFLQSCVLKWEEGEVLKLKYLLSEITQELSLKVNMIKPIHIIKTSGLEEWNSAYTRENAIVLPLNRINDSKIRLKKLIIHEIFHVLSKCFPSIRNKLYSMFGYDKINNIILPDKLKAIKLTNPDAPIIDYCTWVYVKEKIIPVVPIVLLEGDRVNVDSSKDIINSITVKMLVLEEKDGCFKVSEKSSLLSKQDISSFKNKKVKFKDQFEHPEEISANLFTKVIMGEVSDVSGEILNGFHKYLIRK